MAVDGDGNLYVADRTDARVLLIDPGGRATTVAGTGDDGFSGDDGPAIRARLSGPIGITVDGNGNLFIADTGNGRVRKVDANGTITTVVGSGA